MSNVLPFVPRQQWDEEKKARQLARRIDALYLRLGTDKFSEQAEKARKEQNDRVIQDRNKSKETV